MFAPIHDLLAREDLSAIDYSRRLKLMSVRYAAAQVPYAPEPWDGQLSGDFAFLDDISSAHPWLLAVFMTVEHLLLFLKLHDEDFPKSERLRGINKIWNLLCSNVKECALSDDSLVDKLALLEIVSH